MLRLEQNLRFELLQDLALYKQLRRSPADGLDTLLIQQCAALTDQLLPRLRSDFSAAWARDMIETQCAGAADTQQLCRRLLEEACGQCRQLLESVEHLQQRLLDCMHAAWKELEGQQEQKSPVQVVSSEPTGLTAGCEPTSRSVYRA
jgi:hypothetical protein